MLSTRELRYTERHLYINEYAMPVLTFLNIDELLVLAQTSKTWYKRVLTAKFWKSMAVQLENNYFSGLCGLFKAEHEISYAKWICDGVRSQVSTWQPDQLLRWYHIARLIRQGLCLVCGKHGVLGQGRVCLVCQKYLWSERDLRVFWKMGYAEWSEIPCLYTAISRGRYWLAEDLLLQRKKLKWPLTVHSTISSERLRAHDLQKYNYLPKYMKERFTIVTHGVKKKFPVLVTTVTFAAELKGINPRPTKRQRTR